MKFMYDPSTLGRLIFPNVVWNSPVNKILLTIDDSPNPDSTPEVFNLLDTYKIKSIFFCVGDAVTKFPGLVDEIMQRGHIIGNHGFTHRKLLFKDEDSIKTEISNTNKAIQQAASKTPEFFRPPYGRLSPRIVKITGQHGLKTMMWSLLTYDYKNDSKIVKFALDKYLRSNSVIVFHDRPGNKNILYDSINYLIEKSNSKGFQIGDPHECLK